MRHYRSVILLAAMLCVGNVVRAQATGADAPPTPAPTPLTSGWNVAVNGGYSSVSNAGTNNGFFFSTELRLSDHYSARGDVFVLTDPSVTVTLAKAQYRFAPKFKTSSYALPQNMEFFANVGVGDARYNDPAQGTQSKFAWGIGGGFDVRISDTVSVRPLDVNYLRSSLIGGGRVIGNHLNLAASLGLRF